MSFQRRKFGGFNKFRKFGGGGGGFNKFRRFGGGGGGFNKFRKFGGGGFNKFNKGPYGFSKSNFRAVAPQHFRK